MDFVIEYLDYDIIHMDYAKRQVDTIIYHIPFLKRLMDFISGHMDYCTFHMDYMKRQNI